MAKQPQVVAGLVRRYIQLRSGNRAWRMVRPDNPNIVDPQPADPQAQRQQPAKPAEAPKQETPVVDKTLSFHDDGYPSCCGASFMVPLYPTAKDDDPRAKAFEYWKQHYQGQQKIYLDYAKDYQKDLDESFSDGQRAHSKKYRLTRRYLEQSIQNYKTAAAQYDFETLYKAGNLTRNNTTKRDMSKYKGPGCTISVVPFHGSKPTPAGLHVRCDQDINVDYCGTPFEVPAPFDTPDVNRNKTDRPQAFYSKKHEHPDGFNVWCLAGMFNQDLANDIATAVAKSKDYKVGDVITFILNKSQGTQQKLNKLAAAGYRHVLTTSNSTHGGSSILYLFERKLTLEDLPNEQ